MQQANRAAREVLFANVRRLHANAKMTEEALADAAGLHRTFVGAVERSERNISLDNIERLAVALHIEVFELLRPSSSERAKARWV